ncbi:DUF3572 domain-containing protein [Sphingomonas lenta]|uniref:DUF3572 domain-containing protein n=1 Tax=Sphingomonas lenta TaxID=1141887 RepID=A0A2A2SEG7_9SPHN|nr:DUF3572 domain-containing protein [Sphingomonas lenta]PAX07582.1 hypothetical protein CKY28_07965 [Sphingomonas lenta]
MRDRDTIPDATALGLKALVWTLSEPDRAQRLLDVTGLDPADLRARAGEPAVLSAVLGFLEAHQPDLLACAEELEVKPEALVRAHEELEGPRW